LAFQHIFNGGTGNHHGFILYTDMQLLAGHRISAPDIPKYIYRKISTVGITTERPALSFNRSLGPAEYLFGRSCKPDAEITFSHMNDLNTNTSCKYET
jgi:hypothetical protein